MPYSHPWKISSLVAVMLKYAPDSILDVGAGEGMYGFLARHHLVNQAVWEGVGDASSLRIDAIEGYEPYITDNMRLAYDEIIVEDALTALGNIENHSYDLVLALDILEHFDRLDGLYFLQECRRVGRLTIIATPNHFIHQESAENPLENHRSIWRRREFKRLGAALLLPDDYSLIALFASDRLAKDFCVRWPWYERRRKLGAARRRLRLA